MIRSSLGPGRVVRYFALLFLALAPTAVTAQDGPYFEMLDPPVFDDPKNWGGTWTVDNGIVTQDLYDGRYVSSHGWSVQAAFDATGFDMGLHVSGGVTCGRISVGTAVSSEDFTFANDLRSVDAYTVSEGEPPDCPQKTTSNSAFVHIVPSAGTYAVGDKLEIYVGASYGPGVRYTYTVTRPGRSDGKGAATTSGGGDDTTLTGAGDKGTIKAILDCPDSIMIGELPGLQCALEISGYVRNTSAPVVVSSPTEVDGYGNTTSGIQLSVLTGAADPSNWDSSYHWPFSPFACAPGSPGVGANCYDNFTLPGEKVIPIVVSQEGVGQATVRWVVRAIGGAVKGSPYNGNWRTTFGDMTIAVSGNEATGGYAFNGGLIYGTADGAVLYGAWVQPGGSGRECDTEFQGVRAWGRFVFTLAADGRSFVGTWGYCDDDPVQAGWDGVRP